MKIDEEVIEQFCLYSDLSLIDVKDMGKAFYVEINSQRCDITESYIVDNEKWFPADEENGNHFRAGYLTFHWEHFLAYKQDNKDSEYIAWYVKNKKEEQKKADQEYLDWYNGLNA